MHVTGCMLIGFALPVRTGVRAQALLCLVADNNFFYESEEEQKLQTQ